MSVFFCKTGSYNLGSHYKIKESNDFFTRSENNIKFLSAVRKVKNNTTPFIKKTIIALKKKSIFKNIIIVFSKKKIDIVKSNQKKHGVVDCNNSSIDKAINSAIVKMKVLYKKESTNPTSHVQFQEASFALAYSNVFDAIRSKNDISSESRIKALDKIKNCAKEYALKGVEGSDGLFHPSGAGKHPLENVFQNNFFQKKPGVNLNKEQRNKLFEEIYLLCDTKDKKLTSFKKSLDEIYNSWIRENGVK